MFLMEMTKFESCPSPISNVYKKKEVIVTTTLQVDLVNFSLKM